MRRSPAPAVTCGAPVTRRSTAQSFARSAASSVGSWNQSACVRVEASNSSSVAPGLAAVPSPSSSSFVSRSTGVGATLCRATTRPNA